MASSSSWGWLWGSGQQQPQQAPPVVDTLQGKIRGKVSHLKEDGPDRPAATMFFFRGVPYATPTRFRKPEPLQPRPQGSVLDCRNFGKMAVQGMDLTFAVFLPSFIKYTVIGFLSLAGWNPLTNTDVDRPQALTASVDEDKALNLNIETPTISSDARLPVMVFFHGGGFFMGASSQVIYHAKECPISRQGVVLVTANYRLGMLGFLKVEGGDYNVGIWDQVAALQWVQENIANFGGDPGNVTIFGESAGAMSCAVHSVGPFAGKLFHRVILQSGCLQAGITKEQASWVAEDAAQVLKKEPGSTLSVDDLKGFKADKLVTLQNVLTRVKRQAEMAFQPVIEGELLQDSIVNCWKKGLGRGLDAMVGYLREEELLFYKIFPNNYTCETEEDLLKRVKRLFGPKMLGLSDSESLAEEAVREIKDLDTHNAALGLWTSKCVALSSLLKFSIPAHVSAHAMLDGGYKNVYLFRFDVVGPGLHGAAHALDLPYVFGTYKWWGPAVNRDMEASRLTSEAVIHAWIEFARTGNPNGDQQQPPPSSSSPSAGTKPPGRLPLWPAVVAGQPDNVMVIDLPVSNSRSQHVDLREVPLLFKLVKNNTRAFWFAAQRNQQDTSSISTTTQTNGSGKPPQEEAVVEKASARL